MYVWRRLESKVFPKLTEVGSDGLFYSQDQIREVVAYAADRGIRVVPEFEMPGHSTAWLLAYPELSSGPAPAAVRRTFGISPYAMDPTREQTYVFLERFLAEMVALFPDAYVHIGGDETTAPEWKTNPRILRFMQEHDLDFCDGAEILLLQARRAQLLFDVGDEELQLQGVLGDLDWNDGVYGCLVHAARCRIDGDAGDVEFHTAEDRFQLTLHSTEDDVGHLGDRVDGVLGHGRALGFEHEVRKIAGKLGRTVQGADSLPGAGPVDCA
jgi:hypothetical protein